MPAHKKTVSKTAKSAAKKNCDVVSMMKDKKGGDHIVARIDANLGTYFRLTAHDGEKVITFLGSPRGIFKQKKAQIRFSANDLVVLSGIPTGLSEISEIVALLGRSDAQDLYKDGLIHATVYAKPDRFSAAAEGADDDFFDYTGVEEEEEFDIDAI